MASSSSTSRLSALAPPFTISPQVYQQQEQEQEFYASLMFDSIPALHLDDDIQYAADSDSLQFDSIPALQLDDDSEYAADSNSLQSAPSFTGAEGAITGKMKELYPYKTLFDKGKELGDYIFVPSPSQRKDEIVHQRSVLNSAPNPVSTGKYDLPDPHSSVSTLDVPSTLNGNPAKKSSESFDMYESDIDSPCWKGITVSQRSPFTVKNSGSMNSLPPQKVLERCKSLNPLAPKFIPSKTEANFTKNSGNNKQESVANPKGQNISLRANSEVVTQRFGDIPALGNEHVLRGSSSNGHQFDHMTKPSPIAVPARGKRLTREIVGRSVKSINDSAQNVLPCFSSLSIEHVSNVSPSAIAIPTEHWRKYQEGTDSLSETLINNMCTMSELLLENVSDDIDVLSEQQLMNLENVMDNLSFCMGKKNVKTNLVSNSPHPGTYLYNRRAQDFSKEPWKKTWGSSHWLGEQNEQKKQNSLYAPYRENDYILANSFSSTGDAGTRKRNEAHRVMERLVKEKHENHEELICQELLYKNLWLDAEAALCSMKRNAYIIRMRAQMDGSMSD